MARSISTGSPGLTAIAKDQTMDMNGPLVPEKVLKSIQVCDVIFKRFISINYCISHCHRRTDIKT